MKNLAKNSYLITALFLVFTFSFSGCEKLSDEELLTAHPWRWDKMTTTSTNENIIGYVAVFNTLMAGATFEFHSDGTYSLTALNKTDDGTWELGDDKSILLLDGNEMTILKLTKDELVLEGKDVYAEYGIYSATLSLKR